jgi:hypothetical protein
LRDLLRLLTVRLLFGWVYGGSGGSILLLILFHASGKAWSEILTWAPVEALLVLEAAEKPHLA